VKPEAHPPPVILECFMRGELTRSEIVGLVRHLLTGCPRCLVVTRRLYGLGEQPRVLRILLEEESALEYEIRQAKASVFG
jgi:hypothetical protein